MTGRWLVIGVAAPPDVFRSITRHGLESEGHIGVIIFALRTAFPIATLCFWMSI